jgi:nitroimidazol reductase NimA-like FMN-containing flavoprotein (pyridoxamine 5'-phosphate oxidase superfamily)
LKIISLMGGRRLEKAELESILEETRVARFCCLNENGTIHATPVWYRYMNGKIVVLTPDHSRKARNIKRNKNVTILIDLEKPARGVMIYGTAELDYGDILPTAITICEKYMEKEKAKSFAEMLAEKVMDLTVSVKPERMVTFHF